MYPILNPNKIQSHDYLSLMNCGITNGWNSPMLDAPKNVNTSKNQLDQYLKVLEFAGEGSATSGGPSYSSQNITALPKQNI